MAVAIEVLVKNVKTFCKELDRCSNDRYLSWEHCYEAFYQERKSKSHRSPNLEKLCLHLAFYLASWGMYRGSSFLLQRDYRIHRKPIQILLDKKYDSLWGIRAAQFCRDEENVKLVFDLSKRLTECYKDVRREVCEDVRKKMPKVDVSQTLITKILMGTMGCCPAYDRYFVKGISGGVTGSRFCRTFTPNSLAALSKFYVDNGLVLKCVNKKTKELKLPYPQLKIVDMVFWKQGFDSED